MAGSLGDAIDGLIRQSGRIAVTGAARAVQGGARALSESEHGPLAVRDGSAAGVARAAHVRSPGAARAARGSALAIVSDVANAIRVKRKRSFNLREHHDLGTEAREFRDSYVAQVGHNRGWIQSFVFDRWGLVSATDMKALVTQVKCAARAAARHGPEALSGGQRGRCALVWCSEVPASNRRRVKGGGRKPLSEDLGDELFAWFVHRLHTVKGRINSQLLIAQGNLYKTDLEEQWQLRVEMVKLIRPSLHDCLSSTQLQVLRLDGEGRTA